MCYTVCEERSNNLLIIDLKCAVLYSTVFDLKIEALPGTGDAQKAEMLFVNIVRYHSGFEAKTPIQ